MTPIEAWSAVVAGENAAVYAYSVAGARVSADDRRQAATGLEMHRQRRSRASSLVTELGGTPPSGDAAYELPTTIKRPREARRLLADVELALVAIYADAAAAAGADDRRWAARSGADCAASAVAWGAAPQAFPTATGP